MEWPPSAGNILYPEAVVYWWPIRGRRVMYVPRLRGCRMRLQPPAASAPRLEQIRRRPIRAKDVSTGARVAECTATVNPAERIRAQRSFARHTELRFRRHGAWDDSCCGD